MSGYQGKILKTRPRYVLNVRVLIGIDPERRGEKAMTEQLAKIPVDLLLYSGRNPRIEMRGLEELAENIKEYGVLQPIIARPRGEKFEIVIGERRVRASIMAGLKEVPTIIRGLSDTQTDELRLIENVHREDLTNAEKGDAIISLWEKYPERYPTFKSIAKSLNVKYETLQVWLRYSRKLSESLREFVSSSILGEDHARFLLKYDKNTQDKLARILIKHNLNTTQTRLFLKLYDKNPNDDLNELAQTSKGIEVVRVPLKELPREVRKEVKRIVEEKPKLELQTEEIRRKRLKTLRKTMRKQKERKRNSMEEPPISATEPIAIENALESRTAEIPEHVSRLTEQVVEQIRETIAQAPEKTERISEIVGEELKGMRKRLKVFPEKSKKIEPKFDRLETLTNRGVTPYTVWDFQYRDDYAGDKDFHGNCSPQVVEECIWRLSEEGDLVLDPMAGSGTSLDVCRKFNRRCIGYDIKPPANRTDIIQNDSRKIPLDSNSVDMIFIHPPYWNLTTYTSAEERLSDLSRAKTLEEYLKMLKRVLGECFRVLKKRKFMCVLLGDLIREGRFVPLTRKVANLADEIGFIDYGYAVKLAHGEVSRKKSGVIVAEPVYTYNLKISHDLIMFFRKS